MPFGSTTVLCTQCTVFYKDETLKVRNKNFTQFRGMATFWTVNTRLYQAFKSERFFGVFLMLQCDRDSILVLCYLSFFFCLQESCHLIL